MECFTPIDTDPRCQTLMAVILIPILIMFSQQPTRKHLFKLFGQVFPVKLRLFLLQCLPHGLVQLVFIIQNIPSIFPRLDFVAILGIISFFVIFTRSHQVHGLHQCHNCSGIRIFINKIFTQGIFMIIFRQFGKSLILYFGRA